MASPHVYDKARYHASTIEEHDLPEEHAANHTVVFLRWLLEHNLMSDEFLTTSADVLGRYKSGNASIHDVYEWWDCCLIDDMLSDEGNRFAKIYFDFEKGAYIQDYAAALQGDLPTELHIPYTESGYRKMAAVIDKRFMDSK